MTSTVLGFVSDVAGTVASHLDLNNLPPRLVPGSGERVQPQSSTAEQLQRHVPRRLDLHYVTERIIGMAQPAAAAAPTRADKGRDSSPRIYDSVHNDENDTTAIQAAASPISPQKEAQSVSAQTELTEEPPHVSRRNGNCPGTLSTFLSRRHPKRFLNINVSDQDADDRTLLLLNRQIIRFPWLSPCIDKSETPSLSQLFDICYAIHAYLSLDDDRVVLVYCSNGKTRTAIVVACYLKFSGVVRSALDGFRLFCSRRCPDLDPLTICDVILPSLKSFFRNFDDCV